MSIGVEYGLTQILNTFNLIIKTHVYAGVPLTNKILTLIPAWISDHIPIKLLDGIAYSFWCGMKLLTIPKCQWYKLWISKFIPHFIMDVIT